MGIHTTASRSPVSSRVLRRRRRRCLSIKICHRYGMVWMVGKQNKQAQQRTANCQLPSSTAAAAAAAVVAIVTVRCDAMRCTPLSAFRFVLDWIIIYASNQWIDGYCYSRV